MSDLCDRAGMSSMDDGLLEAMTFSALRVISDETHKAFGLPASVLKQFQFIQELYRVSRPGAFTPRLRKQFSEVEKIIRAKTWGSRGEDFPCTSGRHSSPFSKNPHADGARHHRSLVFTDEAPSLKMEHLTLQTNTRSVSMSYYDLEMGLPASSAPTPLANTPALRRKDRGASIDSYATENSCSTVSRFKSLYISPGNCASQETLGDYGFFDEDDVDATVHLEEQFQL
eukprot:gene7496-5387_t